MSGSDHHREKQKILNIMFECLSRVHSKDRIPEDREELMEWVRRQLNLCGIHVEPRGLCHAVLIEDQE